MGRPQLLLFTAVALLTWAAHASLLTALLLPWAILVTLVAVGVTAFKGLGWVGQGTPERRGDFLSALHWLCGAMALTGGMQWGLDSRFDRLEEHFAPFIRAAEAYRAEKGRYPERPEELAPGWVSSLPSCSLEQPEVNPRDPRAWRLDASYGVLEDGSFSITCYTVVFLKYSYDSKQGRWYSWD